MTCQGCGGPVSGRNTTGYCNASPDCKRQGQVIKDARCYARHPDRYSARNAAWRAANTGERAEYFRKRREDPEVCERQLINTQAFKIRPENADRVREYNHRGRARYIARADRPCLTPDEDCSRHPRPGWMYCDEHALIEARRSYHRRTARRKQAMARDQAWVCPWCSGQLPPSLTRTHVDHIIPRASGLVIEEAWNLQLLHGRCNQEKSDKITIRAIILAAEHGLTLAA